MPLITLISAVNQIPNEANLSQREAFSAASDWFPLSPLSSSPLPHLPGVFSSNSQPSPPGAYGNPAQSWMWGNVLLSDYGGPNSNSEVSVRSRRERMSLVYSLCQLRGSSIGVSDGTGPQYPLLIIRNDN